MIPLINSLIDHQLWCSRRMGTTLRSTRPGRPTLPYHTPHQLEGPNFAYHHRRSSQQEESSEFRGCRLEEAPTAWTGGDYSYQSLSPGYTR
jgi:hypothetical protein